MEFIPAGEIIGQAHQVRTIRLIKNPRLPDGEYMFIDLYCTDPECDCRKTMIQVLHEKKLVSVINYGWEPREFYRNWMGSNKMDPMIAEMQGASIDLTSPDIVNANGMLDLFNALLNEKWIANFKRNYKKVKAAVSSKSK